LINFKPWRDNYSFKNWTEDWTILAGFFSNERGSKKLSQFNKFKNCFKSTYPNPVQICYILINCNLFSRILEAQGHIIIEFRNNYYAHLGELYIEHVDLDFWFTTLDTELKDLNKRTIKNQKLAEIEKIVKTLPPWRFNRNFI